MWCQKREQTLNIYTFIEQLNIKTESKCRIKVRTTFVDHVVYCVDCPIPYPGTTIK